MLAGHLVAVPRDIAGHIAHIFLYAYMYSRAYSLRPRLTPAPNIAEIEACFFGLRAAVRL